MPWWFVGDVVTFAAALAAVGGILVEIGRDLFGGLGKIVPVGH
jgi:hypothetical protein